MTVEDEIYDLMDTLDTATIDRLKADEEIRIMFRDIGNHFIAGCYQAIEAGADPKEQNRYIALQEQILTQI